MLYTCQALCFLPSEACRAPEKEKGLQKVGGQAGPASAVLCEPTLGLSLEQWRGEVCRRRGGSGEA